MTDPQTAIEYLLEVDAVLREHAPEAVGRWFCGAVESFLHDGTTLSEGLHLKGNALRCYRLRKRNQHIREAWELIEPLESSDWKRSMMLSKEVVQFRSIVWPRCRHHDQPPESFTPCRKALFQALKTGIEIPVTTNQLHDIAVKSF